jgi:hypothetical protein
LLHGHGLLGCDFVLLCLCCRNVWQVLRDFVRVLNPANAHSTMSGWNRRWLLRLNGETQKQQAAACDNQTGEAGCDVHNMLFKRAKYA